MATTYFWDFGFDLEDSTRTLHHGLVERYYFPPAVDAQALKVGPVVFHPNDTVELNLFNLTAGTTAIAVNSLSGSIEFQGGVGPFKDQPAKITFRGSGPGTPGSSAVFTLQPYPHWLVLEDLQIYNRFDRFRFRVDVAVDTSAGQFNFYRDDPEMIIGSDG